MAPAPDAGLENGGYRMFKKILVLLDGSELAAKIIPQVVGLAKAMNAEVTLLNVYYTELWGEATPCPEQGLCR